MRYVSIWLFISSALGIISGKFFSSANFFFLIFLAGSSLLAAIFFYKKHKLLSSDVFILFLFFFLGLIWIKPYTVVLPAEVLIDEIAVYGKVDRPAKEFSNFRTYATGPNYIIRGNEKIYYPGLIFVKDYTQQEISYLDYYLFKGKLRRSGYGSSKYALYISGKNPPSLVKESAGVRKSAFIVSEKLASVIESNFPEEITPFILSIFLGKREELSKEIKDIFANAGTAHILAISGLHIGIVAGIFLFMLKIVRLKRKARYAVTAFIIIGYAFLCGLKTPVARASIMFLLWVTSFLLRRRPSVFNVLAVSGLINLSLRPFDIFSISFQLSYIAVLFIAAGFKYIYPIKDKAGFAEKIKILFLSSVFANLGLMPLVSFYWGKIYVLNIFTNIIVIPYLGLIISSLFVFLGLYLIQPLRVLLSASCGGLVLLFLRLNHFFAELPLSYLEYRLSPAGTYICYVSIVTLLAIYKKNPRPY